MAVNYFRKCLGVGPYTNVDEYFADIDPDNNMRTFIQTQIDAGNINSIQYKLASAQNAVYCKGSVPNDSVWDTILTNEATAGFNFKVQMNMIIVTEAEYDSGE
tara:strand:+ start:328 stop:636 length:309 start_codon:yes stop_codon:yes gene_type:complete